MAEKKLASFMESLDISTQVFGFFGASKPGGFLERLVSSKLHVKWHTGLSKI